MFIQVNDMTLLPLTECKCTRSIRHWHRNRVNMQNFIMLMELYKHSGRVKCVVSYSSPRIGLSLRFKYGGDPASKLVFIVT